MANSVPPIEHCCDKEIYAFFGLAAYLAQVVEHGALSLAVILRISVPKRATRRVFDELYNSLSKRTLGRLLAACKKDLVLAEEDQKLLSKALDLRNRLTHHFFREHAINFAFAAGRETMMRELQEAISVLSDADDLLTRVYIPLGEKFGLTQNFIDQQLAYMQRADQAHGPRA